MGIRIIGDEIDKVFIEDSEVDKIYLGEELIYQKSTTGAEPLCFTSTYGLSAIMFVVTGTVDISGVEYSTDKINWYQWISRESILITLEHAGDKLYVRNTNNTLSTGSNNYFNFSIHGVTSVSGNCKSMLNNSSLKNYCFYKLFANCEITTAPELPSLSVAEYSYYQMFKGTDITTMPNLPATALERYCYYEMFADCEYLDDMVELPCISLPGYAYYGMFRNCVALTKLPNLSNNNMQTYAGAYEEMFSGCSLIKLSETQTGEYQNEYTIPPATALALRQMFKDTGGTFTGSPLSRTTYYTSNTIVS